MWGRMKDAMPTLALPMNNDLKAQLTQREYGFTTGTGRIRLESKKDMSTRGLMSPDIADALALTFASDPATDVSAGLMQAFPMTVQSDYDPLEAKF